MHLNYDFLGEIEINKEVRNEQDNKCSQDACIYCIEYEYKPPETFIEQSEKMTELSDEFVVQVRRLMYYIQSKHHYPAIFYKEMSWTPYESKPKMKFKIKYVMKEH